MIFFIMEIDSVLCELGAEAYGTTDDLKISPLTAQLYEQNIYYITEYLATWQISTGTMLPAVYERAGQAEDVNAPSHAQEDP
jgi:hypothetical protein